MVRGQGHQRFTSSWNDHRCDKTDDMLLDMTGERNLYIFYVLVQRSRSLGHIHIKEQLF